MNPTKTPIQYMRRALTLARKAWGRTSPNPMVGAVVVRENEIVGEGYHHCAGTPHAEVHALQNAGDKAQGATLYVTLEPCSTYGRTPPCTEAILRAGIQRVYIAVLDPNPQHAGRAVQILESHGVACEVGLCAKEAYELNEAFFYWIQHRKPFVLLKMAQTLDGKIATVTGNSQWITGPQARARVQKLRQWADAICVGGETVRLDQPRLNVRNVKNWTSQPLRLVATQSLTDTELKELMPGEPIPQRVNCRTAEETHAWLSELGQQGITALLVEGGGALASLLLQQGAVQKIEFHIAPKILGGKDSRTSVSGLNPETLSETFPLYEMTASKLGNDLKITAYLTPQIISHESK